jgi:Tfp pilus assembly protein PilO
LRHAWRQARGWGWPGALGLACLVAALLVALLWLPPLRAEARAIVSATRAAESQAVQQRAQRQPIAEARPAAQQFRESFPSVRERQQRLAALLALATEHGLESKRGEFRSSTEGELGLVRYSVTLPLTGPYVQLRALIEAAHASDRALSLDRLRLRRASASAAVVDADLVWSFYMDAEAPAPSTADTIRSASR